jgi:ABC-type glycerol-3-phosphate transport system substrate-binding protein
LRNLSRRHVLRSAGIGAAGVASVAAFAACGETKTVEVEKIVTQIVEVEKVVEKQVAVEKQVVKTVEVAAKKTNFEVRFVTDHTAGPRGAAMQWGLQKFAELRPDIFVKLEPTGNLIDSLAIQFAAGTAPHVALLSQSDFIRFNEDGAFTEISDLLPQLDVVKSDYYFLPDAYTDNGMDHSFPQPTDMVGKQYGMPFQFAISGFVGNVSLMEESGVTVPDSDGGWNWDDWSDMDKKMTNADAGTYGTWARDDYEFQYMPQMYSNGMKKPFNDTLSKTMYDLPEAGEAWEYLINKIHKDKTSPAAEQTKELGGEYGNPFAAGKIGIWPSGRVYSTGFAVPRIKDRFTWSLLPEVTAKNGGPPGHSTNDQPNLVTNSTGRSGNTEQSAALAVFLGGEIYQGRVGIDRGHMPVHRKAIGAPTSVAPPPEGMKWLQVYADRPDNRSLYPFNTWREWWF